MLLQSVVYLMSKHGFYAVFNSNVTFKATFDAFSPLSKEKAVIHMMDVINIHH